MAKKRTADTDTAHTGEVSVADAARSAQIRVIKVTQIDVLEVLVDVGPMTIPYTVAFDGQTLIKSLVDRKATVPSVSGSHLLAWAFAHTQKGWLHIVSYTINGGAEKLLESRSEANKDPDHSVDVVVVERS